MNFPPLTSRQRRYLRALAHTLQPVVQIGRQGTTAAVIAQVDEALTTHELIKIRLGRECPDSPAEASTALAEPTHAEVVQMIGRTLAVFRARKERPSIELPGAAKTSQGAREDGTKSRPAKTPRKPPASRARTSAAKTPRKSAASRARTSSGGAGRSRPAKSGGRSRRGD